MPDFIRRLGNLEAFAAIDLGSNALRAVIARAHGNEVEIIKNLRYPLRLGEDVFNTGEISSDKMEITENAFIQLFHIFMEYNVTQTRATATSAMRDSKNGPELAHKILSSTGIDIEIISGTQEAKIILSAVKNQLPLSNKTALIMDIGGGSTELIIVKDGNIIGVKSFNVGTVRLLRYKNQEELELRIRLQVQQMLRFIKSHIKVKQLDFFIGTGGNLRRIGKIRKKILEKPTSQLALYDEIRHMKEAIFSMSYVDRIRRLELDQNRADVILPAVMLTHLLMQELKQDKILLPKVGLKEGLLISMLKETPKKLQLKD